MRDDIDITALKAELEMRLRELEALRERSAESRGAVELDQTRQGRVSRQDALMQQEMAKEAERRRATEMQRITSALERIESDDYGYCVKCDEEIAAKRLALDPAILTCIACAR